MQRRNTFLAASALLLTAACTFNPKVDPSQLDCKDDNGCPSGYRCAGVTVETSGFCCNNPDPASCRRPGASPTDATIAAGDARPTDAPSDGIAGADGSAGQDANSASDASADKLASDANATDRAAPTDSGPPDFDTAADRAATQVDVTTNSDGAQPDLAGVTIQQDAQVQRDTTSLSDAPILLPLDALVQQDAAALPDGLALKDTAAAQDGPPDVPVGPLPDAASDLSSDTPLGAGPQIISIEGTGTAAAVAPRTEDLAAWNARAADRLPAAHRISSTNPELVVTGTALDGVTLATLKGQTGQGNHDTTIEEKTMTKLTLGWPSTLTAGGLFILSLTAAAGTAEAQVFFLQGEKGDKGDQGDSLFSCAGNDCSTTKNVSVGGLFTAAGGLTSKGVYIGPETTRTINLTNSMSADVIQAAIDAVGKHVPYGVTVTFQFADGPPYVLNHSLSFQGFYGGGRILIRGNPAESTGLHTDQAVFLNFSGQDCDGIEAWWNSATVQIDFLKIMVKTDAVNTAAVLAYGDSYVRMSGDYVLGTSPSHGNAVKISYDGVMEVGGTYVSSTYYGQIADAGSTMFSSDNGSTGTSPSFGLYATYAGTIVKINASQPAGTLATEGTAYGGEIR